MSSRTQRVLVVAGSSRADSNVTAIVSLATQTLDSTTAEVALCDLATLLPPVFVHGDAAQEVVPAVIEIRRKAEWADAFFFVTPEYHGNMSGALKNWFDFLYLELAGKLAGVVAVTGGGGGDMSLTAVERCFSWCHGFCLPYRAAARDCLFADGALQDASIAARVQRIAFDLVRYAAPIRAAWDVAAASGNDVAAGVAGLHAPKE